MKKVILIFLMIVIACITACRSAPEDTPENGASSIMLMRSKNEFDYEIENSSVKITKYLNNDLNVIIPEQISGKPVKTIGKEAFYQNNDTVSITLPQSLTTIENASFYRCYSLTEIVIPKNVNQIGSNPFFRCSSLTKISVESDNAFYSEINGVLFNKDKTELIAYPEGNTSKNYTIPDSVKTIAADAFGYHCSYLKKLTIFSNVVKFPNYNIFIYPDDITLIVESGSAAERYAKKYELKFEIVE